MNFASLSSVSTFKKNIFLWSLAKVHVDIWSSVLAVLQKDVCFVCLCCIKTLGGGWKCIDSLCFLLLVGVLWGALWKSYSRTLCHLLPSRGPLSIPANCQLPTLHPRMPHPAPVLSCVPHWSQTLYISRERGTKGWLPQIFCLPVLFKTGLKRFWVDTLLFCVQCCYCFRWQTCLDKLFLTVNKNFW